MPVAIRANTTGHWSTSQVHVNADPRPMLMAIRSATVGPAMIRNMDATMKTERPIVRRIAVSRVRHQGRDSVTSYAALRVVIIETMAPELDQIVSRNANV